MVVGILGRRKRDIFRRITFVVESLRSCNFIQNSDFGLSGGFLVSKLAAFSLEYPRVFVSASYDWCSTCSMMHIANFAVSA
jgi:hypothetical protein